MEVSELIISTDPSFEARFVAYPDEVRVKLHHLRELILATAAALEEIKELEETLKWGESSFVTKQGSTFRMDWKAKTPEQYMMYFQCTSRLIPTFKLVFGELFQYEGNRALVFGLKEEIPTLELKACIGAALTYHQVKDMLTLGL